jgi:hypothetical protein
VLILTFAEVLELNNNRLGGPIPDKIGDLKKLGKCEVRHTKQLEV